MAFYAIAGLVPLLSGEKFWIGRTTLILFGRELFEMLRT